MEKKVLLVADDDAMNRMILTKFLNEYEVIAAVDGIETLDVLNNRHVDAVILDIIMPELDGLSVLRKMKEDSKLQDISVLVATSTKEQTEREALSIGADDVVSKPYDPVVIRKRLSNIIAAHEASNTLRMHETDETEAIIRSHLEKAQVEINKAANHIRTCARMIAENKENYDMVNEMVKNITTQSDTLESVVFKSEN